MRVSLVALVSVAVLMLLASGVQAQSCLNERGEAVDWFMSIKVRLRRQRAMQAQAKHATRKHA
jgi:hypothetical protein